jgi:Alpha/beta hydrolase family
VLAHGAANGPWVFEGWLDAFPGADVLAVDLQAGLAVPHASMSNYAAVLYRTAELLAPPRALVGWSLGGLVAMLAAERAGAAKVALLEPSPPAEVQGFHDDVEPVEGAYDGETAYGAFPPGIPARPESELALGERRRGISVPRLPPPGLVVYGDEFPDDRGRRVAARYGLAEHHVPGASHWDLVLGSEARAAVAGYLGNDEG